MPTLCRECDFVVVATRKRPPTQWLCSKFPRIAGDGFVDPDYWVNNEPFMKCYGVNGGHCPLFSPRRNENERNNFDYNQDGEQQS